MFDQRLAMSPLGSILGSSLPLLFSGYGSWKMGQAGPPQFYPPGLSRWDPEIGDQGALPAAHCWTGNYIATFLVASVKPADAASVLGKGMTLDPDLLAENPEYPVVLGFGTFENARSSRYPFLGLNYTELLAAIPRVYLDDPKYTYKGPFLFPYRLYLNRLLPTVFGWLSGYPKMLERVALTRVNDPVNAYEFKVGKLWSGSPILDLKFTVAKDFFSVNDCPEFPMLNRLLIPNIIATGFLDLFPVRSFFELDVPNAVAWDVPTADLQIYDPGLFPISPGLHTWKGITHDKIYGAIRLYVPWRLMSADHPNQVQPFGTVTPAAPAPKKQNENQPTR